jgi:hypothetical protein
MPRPMLLFNFPPLTHGQLATIKVPSGQTVERTINALALAGSYLNKQG